MKTFAFRILKECDWISSGFVMDWTCLINNINISVKNKTFFYQINHICFTKQYRKIDRNYNQFSTQPTILWSTKVFCFVNHDSTIRHGKNVKENKISLVLLKQSDKYKLIEVKILDSRLRKLDLIIIGGIEVNCGPTKICTAYVIQRPRVQPTSYYTSANSTTKNSAI